MNEKQLKDGYLYENEPEYTFDFSKMNLTTNIADCYQRGNYLVVTTDKNVTFRYRLPQGKILNKKDGRWVLEDMVIA